MYRQPVFRYFLGRNLCTDKFDTTHLSNHRNNHSRITNGNDKMFLKLQLRNMEISAKTIHSTGSGYHVLESL
jgi:hypothetical protein